MAEHADAKMLPRKVCFVIAPIGEPNTEVRRKSDQVLKHLIKPVLEKKYSIERADKMGRPGIITVQIVQQIFDAELVVADLTGHNPNVYYELAIRHAAQKPAIHIVSRGDQDVPFDVQDMRFVPYDLTDPDILEEACGKLRDAVEAIEQGRSVNTPVQIAQILRSLDAGEDRDAQIRELFESLTAGMSNLQEGITEIVQDLRQRNNPILGGTFGSPPRLTFGSPNIGHAMLDASGSSGFNFPTGALDFNTTNFQNFAKAIEAFSSAQPSSLQNFAKAVESFSEAEEIRKKREAEEAKDRK